MIWMWLIKRNEGLKKKGLSAYFGVLKDKELVEGSGKNSQRMGTMS